MNAPDSRPAPSVPAAPAAPEGAAPPPLDTTTAQLTLRALATGMLLGGLLSACNIYTGLTIGWSLNMSIVSIILSYAFWQVLHGTVRTRPWTMLENNINQTAASSGAAVSSAGLVAPIPALAMLRPDMVLPWHWLALWVFSVCLVGIAVAIPLRRQLILVDRLPFPSGIANAEMLKEMYAKGAEALARVRMLFSAAATSAAVAIAGGYPLLLQAVLGPFGGGAFRLARWGLPFSVKGFGAGSLTFALDPSLLMIGVGGLIGFRACLSLLGGAVLAWLVLAPPLVHNGMIRIAIGERIPALPAGVESRLLPEPDGFLRFRAESGRLEYKGIMTPAERAGFLALSADPAWREAIDRLHLRSQLEPAAPLAALPPGVDLSGLPVRHDARAGELRATGGLTRRDHRALLARSAEPAWRAAVERLYAPFDITTARALPAEVTLPAAGLVVPEDLREVLSFDAASRVLTYRGVFASADREAIAGLLPGDAGFAAVVGQLRDGATYAKARPTFNDLVQWLLWPGVTLMVVSSLVSFGFSWPAMMRAFSRPRGEAAAPAGDSGEVALRWFAAVLVVAMVLSVALQVALFSIAWWAATLGVLLSFVLALVAARVAGETNTTPVGAMGKVTQLVFGALIPNNPAPNLMAANVTGGAASQCADLMHDLKCGHLIGASARLQTVAQVCGAALGAAFGSAVYLVLIPNPSEQLMTEQWAAPAVATWKAVAELFMVGFRALPEGTPLAMLVAGVVGVVLPVLEQVLPKRHRALVPSPASLGLAFVINGFNSISMFVGGLLVLVLGRFFPNWTRRFAVATSAGLVAGESLTGVGIALQRMFFPL